MLLTSPDFEKGSHLYKRARKLSMSIYARRSMFIASLVAITLLITLTIVAASYAVQNSPPDFTEFEKVVLEELKEANTPGATVAIVSGDRVIYTKAFGISSIETGAPMTPDMLFRIGSATELFTATALVTLADEGKLKLDEPIGNHIAGLNPQISRLTAHQLLSHTAGLEDKTGSYAFRDDLGLAGTIRSWKEDQLFSEPGKIMSYSASSYSLAGYLIESIGHKPFADYMTDSIFKPLGMTRTTFRPNVAMTYPLAPGHSGVGKATPTVVRGTVDISARWPAESLLTNVVDLSRFALAFLNGGKLDGKQVLLPSVIAKLSTPRVGILTSPDSQYGYGMRMTNYRGVRVVEHRDSRGGYGQVIKMAPDHRFAVIVLWNGYGFAPKTTERAMELMLPLKPKVEEKEKPDLPMTAAEMANCAGKFLNLEILARNGKLFLKQGTNERPIRKIGENLFSARGPGDASPFVFALVPGADGKAEYFYAGLRASKRATPLRSQAPRPRMPEADEHATEEVAKWWRELTEAANELVAAAGNKDNAVREARNNIAKMNGTLLNENDDGLSRKERDQLNAAIETARQKYSRLLQDRQDKSYRAPVRDSAPKFLNSPFPAYSERARQNHVTGTVKLRVECHADGTIGNVTVVEGLGYGLDERAMDAARRMIFLPAVRDGAFVAYTVPITLSFDLR